MLASALAGILVVAGCLLVHDESSKANAQAGASAQKACLGSTKPTCGHTSSQPPRAGASHSRTTSPDAPHATQRPSAQPTPTSSSMTPSGSAAEASAAASVLAAINQARAQAGLPAFTILSGLELSASRHDQLMADGCGLSHQCPGEPLLGTRETDAGVQWTAAGENIGEGGPVSDTTAGITQMAVGLTQDMLNEKPPNDGHRLNLLSSTFTHIGIAIIWASDGTVWMTQDFAN